MINGWHWTEEEVRILTENPNLSNLVLSDKLGRSVKSISKKRADLGLLKQPGWTAEEIQMVRDNPALSLLELAKLTGRSLTSCHRYRQIVEREEAYVASGGLGAVPVHEPDPEFRGTLTRLALYLARDDQELATTMLKEMLYPGSNGVKVGTTVGELLRDAS